MTLPSFPPGVTGSELDIAGPDTEVEGAGRCEHCRGTRPGVLYAFGLSAWFQCDVCEQCTDIDPSDPEAADGAKGSRVRPVYEAPDGRVWCERCGIVPHHRIPEDEGHCPCGGTDPCDCECHGGER